MKNTTKIYFLSLLLIVPFMYLVSFAICIPVRIYRFIQDPVGVWAMTEINIPKKEKEMPAKEWILNEWSKVGQRENADKIIECESHWNNNTFNINSNKTIDLGYYQWNTVHLKSGVITLAEIADYKTATKKAIGMWKKQGFSPWVCAKILGIK